MQHRTLLLVALSLLLGFAGYCTGQTAGFRYYHNLRNVPTTGITTVAAITDVEGCAAACKARCGCNGFNFLTTGGGVDCLPIRRVVPLEPPPGFESTRPVAQKPNFGYQTNCILAVRGKLEFNNQN